MRCENSRLVTQLQHYGPCAVTEQNRRAAILPVHDSRQRFRTDHQRGLRATCLDESIRYIERVNESAAHRLQIESGPRTNTQMTLNDARGGREYLVRSRRTHNDQIDIFGTHIRRLHCTSGGLQAYRRRRFPSACYVAALDTRALLNPCIRCIQGFLEIMVGNNLFRQKAASTGDACVNHRVFPSRAVRIRQFRELLDGRKDR